MKPHIAEDGTRGGNDGPVIVRSNLFIRLQNIRQSGAGRTVYQVSYQHYVGGGAV